VPNIRSYLGEDEAIRNTRAKSTNTKQALEKCVERGAMLEKEAYRGHQMSRKAFSSSEMEEELRRGHCPKKINFEAEQADSRALVTNSNFRKVVKSQSMQRTTLIGHKRGLKRDARESRVLYTFTFIMALVLFASAVLSVDIPDFVSGVSGLP
jgi:hypothetical protein